MVPGGTFHNTHEVRSTKLRNTSYSNILYYPLKQVNLTQIMSGLATIYYSVIREIIVLPYGLKVQLGKGEGRE